MSVKSSKFDLTPEDHDKLISPSWEADVILSGGFRMRPMDYDEYEEYIIFMHVATGRFYVYWNQTDAPNWELTPVRRVPSYTYELEER